MADSTLTIAAVAEQRRKLEQMTQLIKDNKVIAAVTYDQQHNPTTIILSVNNTKSAGSTEKAIRGFAETFALPHTPSTSWHNETLTFSFPTLVGAVDQSLLRTLRVLEFSCTATTR
jgi:hypothetical protein